MLTRVSDDGIGRFVLARLDHYGIGARHVTPIGGEARTSLAVVESRLENCQSVIHRNCAADLELTVQDVDAVDFSTFDVFVLSGAALSQDPSRAASFHALERAKAGAMPRVMDLDYRPYSWVSPEDAAATYSRAAACDIVVGNDLEFGVLAGAYDDGLSAARDLAAGGRLVIYKMGEKGAITITPDGEFRTGIYAVQALKPTGAGDAFMGAFLSALAAGAPHKDAVLRGSAAAAIVVTRVGCAPATPNAAELDQFRADHPGPTEP